MRIQSVSQIKCPAGKITEFNTKEGTVMAPLYKEDYTDQYLKDLANLALAVSEYDKDMHIIIIRQDETNKVGMIAYPDKLDSFQFIEC